MDHRELKPGSPDAVNAGCKCPVYDNNHGEGVFYKGERQHWINGECPVHGIKEGQSDG